MGEWHEEARALRAEGWTLSQLAERYGVTKSAVSYATNSDVKRAHRARMKAKYRDNADYRAQQREYWRARYYGDPEFRRRALERNRRYMARQKAMREAAE